MQQSSINIVANCNYVALTMNCCEQIKCVSELYHICYAKFNYPRGFIAVYKTTCNKNNNIIMWRGRKPLRDD